MRILFVLFILVTLPFAAWAGAVEDNHGSRGAIVGRVVSAQSGEAIQFAAIFIEGDSGGGAISDEQGRFRLRAAFGEHKVVASFVGYQDEEQVVSVSSREPLEVVFTLQEASTDIDEVVVTEVSQSARLNKTAYNVHSIEIGSLKNTSANITQALSKMSGVNIRESGGVGSDAELSLNGFTGSHVKIFIDGIPQSGNSAFSLNNIPAGFAERIEMYSGVVPIEFGADALGGVVNIITNKATKSDLINIDASYSYGSFNTHKTYLKFGQTLAKSGLTYSINAYQNYSDNNYTVDNYVVKYGVNSSGYVTTETNVNDIVYDLERFHDKYHNETAIGSIGFANTSWADHMMLSFNYSQFYSDIQTGTTQNTVYGERYSEGYSLTPTFEYSKRDFFTDGLDVRLVANYESGYTHNADPATESYNWLGESAATMLTPMDNESLSSNLSTNFTTKYVPDPKHNITFSNTTTRSSRITRSIIEGTNIYSDYDKPQYSLKTISGLSYLVRPMEQIEATGFVKLFYQNNQSMVTDTDTGVASQQTRDYSKVGYGAAATYFAIPKHLQAKLSYERAYRLPTTTELFGDNNLEAGTFDLEPETSNNLNFNLVYTQTFGDKHFLRLDGSLIYRNTFNYIIRKTSTDGDSASYGNYGQVITKGFSIIARYDYDRYISVGGTFNNINPRDAEKYVAEGSSQTNFTYGMRIPNQPYTYANGDATFNFYNIFSKHDQISLIYDLFYQEEFTYSWEGVGLSSTKKKVPMQLSHSAVVNYAFHHNRYNISFEARNLTDENLYDNYSLQKAGRAFYIKLRVNILK
ncbi:MAG: TonB-dependent receptor [Rikenellaceae bacterium]